MGKSENFMQALTQIGSDFDRMVERAAQQVCIYPAKPWHIAEKQRAQAAFDAFQFTKRTPGMSFAYGEAVELAHVGACIKDAIFAHRQFKGNTAGQTFGGAA